MPRLTGNRLPKYRMHASGQAVITLDSTDVYLGPHGSQASRIEYDRVVMEWLANGRSLRAKSGLMVVQLAAKFMEFAVGYYRKDGKPTASIDGIRIALRFLCKNYGRTSVCDFGPLALAAIRNKMIEAGHARVYINKNVDRIRQAFKWGVSQELVPVAAHQALTTLPGLRRGRSAAKETAPVLPVSEEVIEATLPHLRPMVADMVRVQRLTGCRPEEVCMLRPCDIDQSQEIWEYRPESHKMEYRGQERVIFIGPRAQQILLNYLDGQDQDYCFSPEVAKKSHNAERRRQRQTPMTPSQAARQPKARPKRRPGKYYLTNAYRRAIHRACDAVDDARHLAEPTVSADVRLFERWSPNRLRHTAATEIRRQMGLEAAQATLGHANADVTQIYAERDYRKAAEVMRLLG